MWPCAPGTRTIHLRTRLTPVFLYISMRLRGSLIVVGALGLKLHAQAPVAGFLRQHRGQTAARQSAAWLRVPLIR